MLHACLTSVFPNSCFLVNSQMANAQLVDRRSTSKTLSKLLWSPLTLKSTHGIAVDHPNWRSLTQKGCQIHEERRTAGAKKKREQRKSRAASSSGFIDSSLLCPTCGRSFIARIGLISHLRTHSTRSSRLYVFVKVIIACIGRKATTVSLLV